MRIWHEQLIPKLCQKHLCAMWREGLGAYSIITENKKGYSNHPAVKEFKNAPEKLLIRLHKVRNEMLNRGYEPKMIDGYSLSKSLNETIEEWQPLEQQIEILKSKKCKCNL